MNPREMIQEAKYLKQVLNITSNGKGGLSELFWKMKALIDENKNLKEKNGKISAQLQALKCEKSDKSEAILGQVCDQEISLSQVQKSEIKKILEPIPRLGGEKNEVDAFYNLEADSIEKPDRMITGRRVSTQQE